MAFWEKIFGKKDGETDGPSEPDAPLQISENGQKVLEEAQKLFDDGKVNEAANLLLGAANEDKDLLRTDLCRALAERTALDAESKAQIQASTLPAYRWTPGGGGEQK